MQRIQERRLSATFRHFHVVDVKLFLTSTPTFLDDVKEWSGPLGVMLNFDVDVNVKTALDAAVGR